MDIRIEKALAAALAAYEKALKKTDDSFSAQLKSVFNSEEGFLQKVDQLDEVLDNYPVYEDLREVLFDLLLMNFFAADVERLEEDYLESEEWESIEEQTIDRGTELLNLLLYLRECIDEKISPSLEDFLKEFLLVDDDEFQDEYRIYEPMLANQLLIDSGYREIQQVAGKLDQNQELTELFYPTMSFFSEMQPSSAQFEAYIEASQNKAFDAAIYAMLVTYNEDK
ncbi:hypothetical protein GCM10023231_18820 [Olivibacter ginsenosidimutans]|uniref:Uncharacterized protein n=1 Tax=Olivibacter ginsenosidimutans TaxID=1176537 RepID=A0ABP9B9T1_9SPHI